ncbi:MAG: amidase family protein [Erysipelotrichales bacterium]
MHKKTILELHEDLKNNKISVEQLSNSSLEHINSVEPKLKALTNLMSFDNNVEINSVLAGIPYGVKDLVSTKDQLTTNASLFYKEYYPIFDATIMEKLNSNNALLLAKTNLDQFGMGGTNINSCYDQTTNPYDTNRSTGGSSGGSAALVAAGCIPYAIGTDTGDSVRKPADYCGVYGFKPSWGVISRYGVFAYASSLDSVGIFSRCVDDIAIVLENINGFDPRDTSTYNHQQENYFQNLSKSENKLKIGYIKELVDCFENDYIVEHFDYIKEYVQELGYELVELSAPLNLLKMINPVYQAIVNTEATSNLGDVTGVGFGQRIEDKDVPTSIIKTRSANVSKYTKVRMAVGAYVIKESNRNRYYEQAKKVRTAFVDTYQELFNQVDIIIAPSAVESASLLDAKTSDPMSLKNLVANTHLSIANIIGGPSLTMPTYLYQGLPNGFSMMAKPFNDQAILDFAKDIENNLKNKDYKKLESFYNRYVEEVK